MEAPLGLRRRWRHWQLQVPANPVEPAANPVPVNQQLNPLLEPLNELPQYATTLTDDSTRADQFGPEVIPFPHQTLVREPQLNPKPTDDEEIYSFVDHAATQTPASASNPFDWLVEATLRLNRLTNSYRQILNGWQHLIDAPKTETRDPAPTILTWPQALPAEPLLWHQFQAVRLERIVAPLLGQTREWLAAGLALAQQEPLVASKTLTTPPLTYLRQTVRATLDQLEWQLHQQQHQWEHLQIVLGWFDAWQQKQTIDGESLHTLADQLLVLQLTLQQITQLGGLEWRGPQSLVRTWAVLADPAHNQQLYRLRWARHTLLRAQTLLFLAGQAGLATATSRDWCIAAFLADFGMISLSPTLYWHPEPLPTSVQQRLQSHVTEPARWHRLVPDLPSTLLAAAMQHHERLDGTGYPQRLTVAQQEPAAPMFALADTFAAMLIERPDRPAWTVRQTLLSLVQAAEAGQYDRVGVQHLLATGLYPPGSWVQLSTGHLAQVVAAQALDHDPQWAAAPVVRLHQDSKGQPVLPTTYWNLACKTDCRILGETLPPTIQSELSQSEAMGLID